MCDDNGNTGVIVDVDEPVPPMPITALFLGGVGTTTFGIIFILLAVLAECMARLHAVAGALLAVVGVAQVVVGLMSVYQGRWVKRLLRNPKVKKV